MPGGNSKQGKIPVFMLPGSLPRHNGYKKGNIAHSGFGVGCKFLKDLLMTKDEKDTKASSILLVWCILWATFFIPFGVAHGLSCEVLQGNYIGTNPGVDATLGSGVDTKLLVHESGAGLFVTNHIDNQKLLLVFPSPNAPIITLREFSPYVYPELLGMYQVPQGNLFIALSEVPQNGETGFSIRVIEMDVLGGRVIATHLVENVLRYHGGYEFHTLVGAAFNQGILGWAYRSGGRPGTDGRHVLKGCSFRQDSNPEIPRCLQGEAQEIYTSPASRSLFPLGAFQSFVAIAVGEVQGLLVQYDPNTFPVVSKVSFFGLASSLPQSTTIRELSRGDFATLAGYAGDAKLVYRQIGNGRFLTQIQDLINQSISTAASPASLAVLIADGRELAPEAMPGHQLIVTVDETTHRLVIRIVDHNQTDPVAIIPNLSPIDGTTLAAGMSRNIVGTIVGIGLDWMREPAFFYVLSACA